MKPFELFDFMFYRKFYSIRILQSYVYSKGDELFNPMHSTIVAEYKFAVDNKKEII